MLLNDSVLDATVDLELLERCILLVYSMELSVLDFDESLLPCIIRVLARFNFPKFNVHYLPEVKHILNSCLNIPHHFLAYLDLLVGDLGLDGTGDCNA